MSWSAYTKNRPGVRGTTEDVELQQLVDRPATIAGLGPGRSRYARPARVAREGAVTAGLPKPGAGRARRGGTPSPTRSAGRGSGRGGRASAAAPPRLAAFEVAEADDVDEGPLGRVEPERAPGPDLEFFAAQLERARVELVEARRCLQCRASAPPGDGDVDGGGDGIGQAMAGERGLQAQRRERDPLGDLDKVGVGGRSIGPAVDAATEREDLPGVPQGVKRLSATPACLASP